MSQITRCPACSTQFKVVADQLRISDGWVRCGHCAEVFDASESLMPAPPPALLPDVSLTDVRPPPTPVGRADESTRAWGAPQVPPAKLVAAPNVSFAKSAAAASSSVAPDAPFAHPAEVLAVPDPVPPAFLSAASHPSATGSQPDVEPATAFAWKKAEVSGPQAGGASSPPPEVGFAGRQESRVLSPEMLELVLQEPPRTASPLAPRAASLPSQTPAAPVPQPGGYELPYADEFPDTPLPSDEAEIDNASSPEAVPERGSAADDTAPREPEGLVQPEVAPDGAIEGMAADGLDVLASIPVPPAVEERLSNALEADPQPLPSVEFPSVAEVPDFKQAAGEIQHPQRDLMGDTDDDPPQPEPSEDVSFVKAARRRAFWRRPLVRSALFLFGLVLTAVLVVQVAVHERHRLAAVQPQLRPLLQVLCQPLECELAPLRQIADVVIDSSSFNKARGDSYVLAVTMKNRASVPLEMPAVELTLTDAQDQPVLRRVLLPTEMGAPQELPASGEWNASVSVLVTTGGSRVAGYRLLAFYP